MGKKEESYQWCGSSVDELMLSASWHNHEVSGLNILIFTSDGGFAYSRGESQGLVDGMNLE